MASLQKIIWLIISINYFYANEILSSNVFIDNNTRNEIIIVVDSQIHIDYGLSYPITYELSIPINSFDLITFVKFKSEQSWLPLQEKTTNDEPRRQDQTQRQTKRGEKRRKQERRN